MATQFLNRSIFPEEVARCNFLVSFRMQRIKDLIVFAGSIPYYQ